MTRSTRAWSRITFAMALAVALGCVAFEASADKTQPVPAAEKQGTPPADATPAPEVAVTEDEAASKLGDVSATARDEKPKGDAQGGAKDGQAGAKRLGIDLASDEPLEIVAQSFEMVDEPKGGERMRFRGGVKLKQGEAELRCDRLDAYYPEGAGSGRPQSLVATGDVEVVQGEFEMQCTRATFDDDNCLAVCLSTENCQSAKWPEKPARFKRGKDWIEGRELEFNVCTGKLFARCGARLQVAPKPAGAAAPAKPAKPAEATKTP